MAKFRKKPVVIEAIPYELGMEDGFLEYTMPDGPPRRPFIQTVDGVSEVSPGDWIITNTREERSPINPDIFDATYEPALIGSRNGPAGS